MTITKDYPALRLQFAASECAKRAVSQILGVNEEAKREVVAGLADRDRKQQSRNSFEPGFNRHSAIENRLVSPTRFELVLEA
jgi:hypothetical protein